jgi:hypothetical protein
MDIRSSEPDLRALMISGLDGDATAHRALLERLSSQLRAYFKRQLNRIGRGPVEAEDLVQEALNNAFELKLGPLFEVPLGGGSFSELCIKSLHQSCGIEAVHAR